MCEGESLVGDGPARGESDVGLSHFYLLFVSTSALRRWDLISALGGQGTGRMVSCPLEISVKQLFLFRT